MREVNAMAVYYPSDPVERAIQDAFHQSEDGWLSMHTCGLVAQAIMSLKLLDSAWLDDDSLLEQRIEFFFEPHLVHNRDEMVFLTHPLYLRDMLENREINSYLYNPVTFVTLPLAHYLFREYPVHVHVDRGIITVHNDVDFYSIGGLLICEENVGLPSESIVNLQTVKNKDLKEEASKDAVYQLRQEVGVKAASTEVSRGVFKVDEHERSLLPSETVWDKTRRTRGEIQYIEPGENGLVAIQLEDGTELTIGKQFFDHRFVVV